MCVCVCEREREREREREKAREREFTWCVCVCARECACVCLCVCVYVGTHMYICMLLGGSQIETGTERERSILVCGCDGLLTGGKMIRAVLLCRDGWTKCIVVQGVCMWLG